MLNVKYSLITKKMEVNSQLSLKIIHLHHLKKWIQMKIKWKNPNNLKKVKNKLQALKK